MKTFMNSFLGLVFTILGAFTVISCDPCSGVVCNNATCSNGTCICEEGYQKNGASCLGHHLSYVDTSSSTTMQGTVTTFDSLGAQVGSPQANIALDMVVSSTSPYLFTLKQFNFVLNNDIEFMISSSNPEIVSLNTLTTLANPANTYQINGAVTGSQIQLDIKDLTNPTSPTYKYTYKLTYSI